MVNFLKNLVNPISKMYFSLLFAFLPQIDVLSLNFMVALMLLILKVGNTFHVIRTTTM